MKSNLILLLFLCLLPQLAFGSENSIKTKAIFQANCTSCHGGSAPVLFNVLNVKDMIDKGIVQGNADSRLFKALNRTERWMPLGKDPLSLDDKATVLAWLKEGYPSFDEDPPPQTNILSYNEETRCIRNDLFSVNPFVAKNYRYAVLGNYYGNSSTNIDRLSEAVVKLFNSISLADVTAESRGIFIPCAGNSKAILRFDLRAINQTAERWDDIVVDGVYPYHIDRRGIEGFEESVANEKDISDITRAKTIAFVRADWLVETASRDPVYSNLLFKDVKVRNIEDFERKFLGVDTFRQLFVTEEARVAIFRHSGVTLYNREVHEYRLDLPLNFGNLYHSSYWKTFDVLTDQAQRNFLAFPFGPIYTWYQTVNINFLLNRVFINDATEVIFQTPGGQAYSLFDGKGNRIVEALTGVAQHSANAVHPILGAGRNGFTGNAGAILNGTSCFACHSGMNSFVDEGRTHVNLSGDFNNDQINFFNRISYHDQAEIDTSLKAANTSYAVAQKNLGAKQVVYVDNQEPIFATAKAYDNDLDVCQFGLELGFSCNYIKSALYHAQDLARQLGLSETLSGRASRLNVENLQAQIDRDLNLGVAVLFKKKPDPIACKLVIHNKTPYLQDIKAIRFTGKTYEEFFLSEEASKDFEEESDATVDACLYFNNDSCRVFQKVKLEKCKTHQILIGNDGYAVFKKI